jgi:hypothetical protein
MATSSSPVQAADSGLEGEEEGVKVPLTQAKEVRGTKRRGRRRER